jgi:TPR repeat protein
MAEGEHKGDRDNGSINLLIEGIACMKGDGVKQDYDAAMQRFLVADKAENKKATRYVGLMYAQGLGVEQDVDHAIALYREAAKCGSEDAAAALDRLNAE